MITSYICIVWISICVGLLTAVREFTVSGHVGSTAVLQCQLQRPVTETPHIRWSIDSETVFERRGEEFVEGEGYEGRVDVPEDELSKGNCSLVIKNLTLSDTDVYTSYHRVRRTKRSVRRESELINLVELSVYEEPHLPEERSRENSAPTGDAGMTWPDSGLMVLSIMFTLPVLL